MFSGQKCSVDNVNPFCHTTEHCPACASALQMQQLSADRILVPFQFSIPAQTRPYGRRENIRSSRVSSFTILLNIPLSSRRFTHFLIFPRFFLGSSSTASIMLKTKATFLLRSMIVDLKILAADFVSILHPLDALWSVSPRLLKLDSRP